MSYYRRYIWKADKETQELYNEWERQPEVMKYQFKKGTIRKTTKNNPDILYNGGYYE